MTTTLVITRAIKLLVKRCVELDGTVLVVRCTVCLMMMTHTGITHASLAQEERFVYKVGMDLAVKCTVSLGITRWRVTPVIPRDKKFVCRIGTVKTSTTCIVNKPMIRMLVTVVTQMGTKYVYEVGMVHHVIARRGMTRPWVTRAILPPVEESALEGGLVTTVIFLVHRGTIRRVIILAIVALVQRSVCQTGLERTVPCTARSGMILLVNTSAL